MPRLPRRRPRVVLECRPPAALGASWLTTGRGPSRTMFVPTLRPTTPDAGSVVCVQHLTLPTRNAARLRAHVMGVP